MWGTSLNDKIQPVTTRMGTNTCYLKCLYSVLTGCFHAANINCVRMVNTHQTVGVSHQHRLYRHPWDKCT